MPGLLVHIGAILNCPHPVGAVTANTSGVPRVWVNKGAQPVLTVKDLHAVAGCTVQVAGNPHPCVSVRLDPATRVFVNGTPGVIGPPAAILTPAALCYSADQLPQGPPNSSPIQKNVVAT
ncbi:MAG: hypothetical protein AVDCRST_MAG93-1344 [uncultured Chloroflexia bacterium]|uniref:Uncharacterized protein n=1 Tax=uncultured Chloroflexia bacterium TaxID=1672391 RepID=A0A6J4I580_9CHLR|nr:MAG: hypothetical protein AVDCRST_MAG93-1344 [uncultured Chloroflexia bacterium]